MERIKTGIEGFDALVEGGIPLGSVILLSGTPGTGKTIFGLEFLYKGANESGEKCLYVTFEEKEGELKGQASQFGWNLDKLRESGNFQILSIPASSISKTTVNNITSIVEREGIKRVVVDSLSTLSINTPSVSPTAEDTGNFAVRRFIYLFIDKLKQLKGTTSILVSSTPDERSLSSDSVSEFICDGIIYLTYESMGGAHSRNLHVRKMRRTKNDEDIHPLEISSKGIVVHDLE